MIFGEVNVNLSLRKVLEDLKEEWKIKIPGLFEGNLKASLNEGDTHLLQASRGKVRTGQKDPNWSVNI